MSTEYRVVTRRSVDPNGIGNALTNYSKEGWDCISSWRVEGWGDEMVAFLLARKPEAAPATTWVPCSVCEGRGSYDQRETVAILHRIADMYTKSNR